MEMFLMAAAMSVLGVAVSAVLFAAASRDARPGAASSPAERVASREPQRFFATAAAEAALPQAPEPAADTQAVPIEALLLRLEQHIRLEQAAAESFLDTPSRTSLHSRTTSRLVN